MLWKAVFGEKKNETGPLWGVGTEEMQRRPLPRILRVSWPTTTRSQRRPRAWRAWQQTSKWMSNEMWNLLRRMPRYTLKPARGPQPWLGSRTRHLLSQRPWWMQRRPGPQNPSGGYDQRR